MSGRLSVFSFCVALAALLLSADTTFAQVQEGATPGGGAASQSSVIELTPESMVELSLENSYRVQFLNMSVEQTRQQLRAERARLRSSFSLEVSAPQFESVSEEVYNSDLGRNQIVREDSRRVEAQFSVRQPLIVPILGYPTDGYVSLNNRVYRYTQLDDDDTDITYYNRWFMRYTQPLFQPNQLKNSLERAELDFEDSELNFTDDMLRLVNDATNEFYGLFDTAFEGVLNQQYVANLEAAEAAATALAASDPARSIELDQIRVELANAREEVQSAVTDFRLSSAELKTRLNLNPSDSIYLVPEIQIEPVDIDVEEATRYAVELTSRMRGLAINERQNEMRLEETEGRDSFRVDLEFTYGREMRDPTFGRLWADPENTYTIDVNAYIPIWDWGERDARIEASRINLRRTELQIEQAQIEIVTDVENQVRNVEELQSRAVTMQDNLELAGGISEQSLERYRAGTITIVDLLQSLRRELDTSENFLDAYLGWKRALTRLRSLTYYDFENQMPVLDHYGIDAQETGEISVM